MWFTLRRFKNNSMKQILFDMLNVPGKDFRKLQSLAKAIGTDEETTKVLLMEIGARPVRDLHQSWSLPNQANTQ